MLSTNEEKVAGWVSAIFYRALKVMKMGDLVLSTPV